MGDGVHGVFRAQAVAEAPEPVQNPLGLVFLGGGGLIVVLGVGGGDGAGDDMKSACRIHLGAGDGEGLLDNDSVIIIGVKISPKAEIPQAVADVASPIALDSLEDMGVMADDKIRPCVHGGMGQRNLVVLGNVAVFHAPVKAGHNDLCTLVPERGDQGTEGFGIAAVGVYGVKPQKADLYALDLHQGSVVKAEMDQAAVVQGLLGVKEALGAIVMGVVIGQVDRLNGALCQHLGVLGIALEGPAFVRPTGGFREGSLKIYHRKIVCGENAPDIFQEICRTVGVVVGIKGAVVAEGAVHTQGAVSGKAQGDGDWGGSWSGNGGCADLGDLQNGVGVGCGRGSGASLGNGQQDDSQQQTQQQGQHTQALTVPEMAEHGHRQHPDHPTVLTQPTPHPAHAPSLAFCYKNSAETGRCQSNLPGFSGIVGDERRRLPIVEARQASASGGVKEKILQCQRLDHRLAVRKGRRPYQMEEKLLRKKVVLETADIDKAHV